MRIVPLSAEHAEIASCLREADLREIMAYGLWKSARECVEYSISVTDTGWAGVCGAGILAVGGAGAAEGRPEIPGEPPRPAPRAGVAWLLSSALADRYPVSFCKYTRELFGELKLRYDTLVNYTDAGYAKALRWMEWLGFEAGPAAPLRGKSGAKFRPMIWRREKQG